MIIQIGKLTGPDIKSEPLQLPGSRGDVTDGAAKCQDGYEDITDIFRMKKASEKWNECKRCKSNTGNKGMMVKSFSTVHM